MLALFVALGGTAYAAQNAPKDSVVSSSIKDGQVKPQDLGVAKSIDLPEERTISVSNATDEFSVDLKIPAPGLISVFAQSEIRKQSGAAGETFCLITVDPPGPGPNVPLIQAPLGAASVNYFVFTSAPDSQFEGGGAGEGGWVVLPVPDGKQTITFRLSRFGTSTVCRFRNTELHVAPSS